jgi:hypothetical protein
MSAPAFTTGPWMVDGGIDVHEAAEGGVCKIAQCGHLTSYRRGREITLAEVEANARLIAAAPDLYEALAQLLDDLDALAPTRPCTQAIEGAQAALAKARGECRDEGDVL